MVTTRSTGPILQTKRLGYLMVAPRWTEPCADSQTRFISSAKVQALRELATVPEAHLFYRSVSSWALQH